MVNFDVGDDVIILKNGTRDGYENLKGKHGTIRKITHYEHPVPQTLYRVAINGHTNKYTKDGWYLFEAHELGLFCMVGTSFTADDITIKKEEKKKMEILDIYAEKQERKLRNKFDKKMADLCMQDPVYRELSEMDKRINQLNKEHNANVSLDLSDYVFPHHVHIQRLAIEAENDRNFDTLCNFLKEVEAQLHMCETYEQKQQILKAYKIIDENGKIKN